MRVDNFNEVVTVLKYRVVVDEHTITSSLAYPIAHVPIGTHLDERDFIVYFDKGAQLSALALRSRPNAVLAMYDFSTGETWPWRAPMETDGHRQERGAQLLAKLKGSSGLPPQGHLEGDLAK